MSRILALSTLAVLVVSPLSFSTSALAADAVIEEDPAPPEPTVELSPENRWYVGARIGAAFADDTSFNTLGTVVTNSYDTGYVFSGAIGYEFGTDSPISARLEGELGYTAFDIDAHSVAGVGNFSGGNAFGETTALYGLVNGFLDYNLGVITPFVGAGVGYANVDFSGHGTTPTGIVMNNDSSGLAWQVSAGAAYALTENTKLDFGYRYQEFQNVDLTAVDGTTSSTNLSNHELYLGIRRAF